MLLAGNFRVPCRSTGRVDMDMNVGRRCKLLVVRADPARARMCVFDQPHRCAFMRHVGMYSLEAYAAPILDRWNTLCALGACLRGVYPSVVLSNSQTENQKSYLTSRTGSIKLVTWYCQLRGLASSTSKVTMIAVPRLEEGVCAFNSTGTRRLPVVTLAAAPTPVFLCLL
jgi:hypothetical protein